MASLSYHLRNPLFHPPTKSSTLSKEAVHNPSTNTFNDHLYDQRHGTILSNMGNSIGKHADENHKDNADGQDMHKELTDTKEKLKIIT